MRRELNHNKIMVIRMIKMLVDKIHCLLYARQWSILHAIIDKSRSLFHDRVTGCIPTLQAKNKVEDKTTAYGKR